MEKYRRKSEDDVFAIQWTGNNLIEMIKFITSKLPSSNEISFKIDLPPSNESITRFYKRIFIFGIINNYSSYVHKKQTIKHEGWLVCSRDPSNFKFIVYENSTFEEHFEELFEKTNDDCNVPNSKQTGVGVNVGTYYEYPSGKKIKLSRPQRWALTCMIDKKRAGEFIWFDDVVHRAEVSRKSLRGILNNLSKKGIIELNCDPEWEGLITLKSVEGLELNEYDLYDLRTKKRRDSTISKLNEVEKKVFDYIFEESKSFLIWNRNKRGTSVWIDWIRKKFDNPKDKIEEVLGRFCFLQIIHMVNNKFINLNEEYFYYQDPNETTVEINTEDK